MKKVYDESRDVYAGKDSKGYFDVGYYDRKLNDIFMDANGNGVDIASINIDAPKQILDDPEGYNIDAIAQDFVGELPERLMKDYKEQANKLGLTYDIDSFKSKLFRQNEGGKIEYDPETNLPKLNLTPEVIRGAMSNTLIKNYVENRIEKEGGDKEDILKEILMPYDGVQQESDVKIGHKFSTEGDMGFSVPKKRVDVRYDTLRNAVYNLDKSSLAQAANDVSGVNLEFIGGEPGPGQSASTGRPDRIRVTIRRNKDNALSPGELAKPIVQDIQLNSAEDREAALFRLNEIIDKAQGASSLRIGPG